MPYKGSGPALIAVISGEVQLLFGGAIVTVPQVKNGKLRALAVAGDKRARALPDVPTVAESGFPGYEANSLNGIVAPAGTPRPIVDRLNAELHRALALPEIQAKLKEGGNIATPTTPEAMNKQITDEIATWKQLVEANNIQVQ